MIRITMELAQGEQVAAVGIGTPGFVDSRAGRVLLATNLPGWTGTDVVGELKQHLPFPIVVENDANVAAIGEAWMGAGKKLENFFMITLGTGVGGALYDHHKGLWYGVSYRGGEVGHAILYPGGQQCACGQRGCVEQYLAGHALEANYFRLANRHLNSGQIFAAAPRDEAARQVVNRCCRDLAVLLTSLANLFDPAGFVIGGGLVHLRKYWWPQVLEALQEECVHGGQVSLFPASTGNDAGLLGAAFLALRLDEGTRV
ncbi:MAG: ROK family protein [Firmicutes bacterium]|nr:ROK family protein [Bacillota bacterium]